METNIMTFVLVMITAYYAKQTKDQVNEARKARESYSSLDEKRLKEVIRVSARVIYIELMTAISEIISICQIKEGLSYTPRNISFNKDFSVHCANLGNSLSFEEMTMVNALYGMIEKINIEISKINYLTAPSYGSVEYSADLLGDEVFGSGEFYQVAKKYNFKAFDQGLIINEMKQVYFELFNKLKKLAI